MEIEPPFKEKIKQLALQFCQQSNFTVPYDRPPASGKVFGHQELLNLIEASLEGWWTEGKWSLLFEQKIKKFLGLDFCLPCNSGSSANFLAMRALTSPKLKERKIEPLDEVITQAACFPTTVNAILQAGAVPVFIDIDLQNLNPSLEAVEKALSPKTKAVFLAHTLGSPFPASEIRDLCLRHNLWLLEDNSDALGSRYNGKYTGTFGDLATLSFYPAHHITTGEGGAVLTSNPFLAKIVRSIRDWGRDCWCPTGKDNTCGQRFNQQLGNLPFGYDHKFTFSEIGFNLKITDLQAAIGVAQMDKLQGFIEKRKQNFDYLFSRLLDLTDYFILPKPLESAEASWFGFLLTIKDKRINRPLLLQFLADKGVGTRLLFGGNIIKQPYFIDNRLHYRTAQALVNTDIIIERSFWVGIYPGLDQAHLDYIVQTLKEFLSN